MLHCDDSDTIYNRSYRRLTGSGGLRSAAPIAFELASYNTQKTLPHTRHKGFRLIHDKKDFVLYKLRVHLCSLKSSKIINIKLNILKVMKKYTKIISSNRIKSIDDLNKFVENGYILNVEDTAFTSIEELFDYYDGYIAGKKGYSDKEIYNECNRLLDFTKVKKFNVIGRFTITYDSGINHSRLIITCNLNRYAFMFEKEEIKGLKEFLKEINV